MELQRGQGVAEMFHVWNDEKSSSLNTNFIATNKSNLSNFDGYGYLRSWRTKFSLNVCDITLYIECYYKNPNLDQFWSTFGFSEISLTVNKNQKLLRKKLRNLFRIFKIRSFASTLIGNHLATIFSIHLQNKIWKSSHLKIKPK